MDHLVGPAVNRIERVGARRRACSSAGFAISPDELVDPPVTNHVVSTTRRGRPHHHAGWISVTEGRVMGATSTPTSLSSERIRASEPGAPLKGLQSALAQLTISRSPSEIRAWLRVDGNCRYHYRHLVCIVRDHYRRPPDGRRHSRPSARSFNPGSSRWAAGVFCVARSSVSTRPSSRVLPEHRICSRVQHGELRGFGNTPAHGRVRRAFIGIAGDTIEAAAGTIAPEAGTGQNNLGAHQARWNPAARPSAQVYGTATIFWRSTVPRSAGSMTS